MSVVCIHHSADMDGLFSGAVVKHHRPDAQLIGWDYGDPVPEIPDDVTLIYLVDLSIPELMADERLVWIDHHKSAIERYTTFIRGLRIDGVAACRLAWQWFSLLTNPLEDMHDRVPSLEDFVERRVEEPYVLTLVGEYDVWDKRDPLAELLNYRLTAAAAYHFDGSWLLPAQRDNVEALAREGSLCRDALLGHYRRAHSAIEVIRFEGLRFACLNGRGNSMAFEFADLGEADALMLWRYDGGGLVRVSLYHRPGREDLDLSEIARRNGGGGHRGACGFECWLGEINEVLRAGTAEDHGEGEG